MLTKTPLILKLFLSTLTLCITLSRRQPGFESPWGRQEKRPFYPTIHPTIEGVTTAQAARSLEVLPEHVLGAQRAMAGRNVWLHWPEHG
jgi:hypothetical protein